MGATLHYRFERRSKNYLDWLINTIKSERYSECEAIIVTESSSRSQISLTTSTSKYAVTF